MTIIYILPGGKQINIHPVLFIAGIFTAAGLAVISFTTIIVLLINHAVK